MATETNLIMDFIDDSGETKRVSYANVDSSVSTTLVKQLITAITSNSTTLLTHPLVSCKLAFIRTTTDTVFDISNS